MVGFKVHAKIKKNIVLAVAVILLGLIYFFVVQGQHLGDSRQEMEAYSSQLDVTLDYFDPYTLKSKSKKQTYDNLLQQKQLTGQVMNGVVFDDQKAFLAANIELNALMLAGYKNHYAGASGLSVPDEYTLQVRQKQYVYLQKHHLPLVMDNLHSTSYTIALLSLVSGLLVFLIILMTGDFWLVNRRHLTVLQNVPETIWQQAVSKLKIAEILVLGPLVTMIILAWLFAGLKTGFTSLAYPVIVHLGTFLAWPFWGYVLLFIGLAAFLTGFLTMLSLVLNQLTDNFYLTIFGELGLFGLSVLPASIRHFLWWLPSNYFNINQVLDGTVSHQTWINSSDFPLAMLVFSIWTVLLLWIFTIQNRRDIA